MKKIIIILSICVGLLTCGVAGTGIYSEYLSEAISEYAKLSLDYSNRITNLENELKKCSVSYVCDKEVIYTETVVKGNNVSSIPTVPTKEGYTGAWDKDGSNITSDTVICCVYTPVKYKVEIKTNLVTGKYIQDHISKYEGNGITVKVFRYSDDYSCQVIRDIVCETEGYFKFNNQMYYIDNTYRNVHKENEEGEVVASAMNDFNLDNYDFHIVENRSHYTATSQDPYFAINNESMITCFDNNIYKVTNDKIINILDNSVLATLTERKMVLEWDDYIYYKVADSKLYYNDGKGGEDVLLNIENNVFELNNHKYYCDIDNYEYYAISKNEGGYIDETKKPLEQEFSIGDVVVINNWDYDNVKIILFNDGEIDGTKVEYTNSYGEGKANDFIIKYASYTDAIIKDGKLYIFGLSGNATIYFNYQMSV